MGHSYYSYTKEELVGNGPKLPVIVMEDNAEVFHSMAVEMVDEIRKHNENGEKTVLFPGDIYAFDGNEKIHSRGICRDINVMFRKDSAEGTLQFLELAVGSELRISAPLLPTVALSDCFMGVYCFCGTCSVEYSGDESKKLSEGTFLLLNEVGNEYLKICAEKSQVRLYIISIRNKAKARR